MGEMGINLQAVDAMYPISEGGPLSLLPAFIIHGKSAPQTRLPEELCI